MATLAYDQPRAYEGADFKTNDFPVVAADIIYEGAAVGDNASGYARPLVAADPFWGFATRKPITLPGRLAISTSTAASAVTSCCQLSA